MDRGEYLYCFPSQIPIIRQPSLTNEILDITLFEQRSSYKVQRSNENGAYDDTEEPLLPTILANTCQEFETEADINPCDKNVWKVRMRGSLHNEKAENNWMYKDLDCTSVLSEELPMAREEVSIALASIASISISPTRSFRFMSSVVEDITAEVLYLTDIVLILPLAVH